MDPHEYCASKAAASGSSFYYAFRFLPPRKKAAIQALYAFCREVDDAVDKVSDPQAAATRLGFWRGEIEAVFSGTPQHPVGRALAEVVPEFGLDEAYFHEIIDGVAMDLEQDRYATFTELQLYCYRVASVVGLLSIEIFGYTQRATRDYAHRLGIAFQLTNILRDVGEDAASGRIYLPQEDLEAFGVTEGALLEGRAEAGFRDLLAFEVERARNAYDEALAELPQQDRWNQLPGLVMAAIYRQVLEQVAHDPDKVLVERVGLSPLRKLWIAWQTYRRERKRARKQ